jgi:hypothetical protein
MSNSVSGTPGDFLHGIGWLCRATSLRSSCPTAKTGRGRQVSARHHAVGPDDSRQNLCLLSARDFAPSQSILLLWIDRHRPSVPVSRQNTRDVSLSGGSTIGMIGTRRKSRLRIPTDKQLLNPTAATTGRGSVTDLPIFVNRMADRIRTGRFS